MNRDYREFQDRSVALAYLITFRCYGTWLHGDIRGSVDRRYFNRFGTEKIAAIFGNEGASLNARASGNVAFMRFWADFFWERNDNPKTKDRLGLTQLPSGGAGQSASLGGYQIAISKYARHPREAIELVRYAAGQEAQLQRVVSQSARLPTILDIYADPAVVAIHPELLKIKEIFSSGNVVVRPSKVCGKLYPQVSKAYSTAVHSILTGQVEAATAVAELEAELVEITGFPVGRPG
jgi:trehalose/maltose transport system substrate-binding protein